MRRVLTASVAACQRRTFTPFLGSWTPPRENCSQACGATTRLPELDVQPPQVVVSPWGVVEFSDHTRSESPTTVTGPQVSPKEANSKPLRSISVRTAASVSVCANRRPPFARPTPNLRQQKLSTLRNVAALAIWFWPRTDHHQPRVAKGSLESAFNTPMSINGPLCHSSRYIPITSPSDSFALQVAVTGLFFQRTSRKKASPKYRAFLLTHRTRRLIL